MGILWSIAEALGLLASAGRHLVAGYVLRLKIRLMEMQLEMMKQELEELRRERDELLQEMLGQEEEASPEDISDRRINFTVALSFSRSFLSVYIFYCFILPV